VGFNTFEWQFIQLELNTIKRILKLNETIHFTTDLEYFTKHGAKYNFDTKKIDAMVEPDTGLIWLNESNLSKEPLIVLKTQLWHEVFHIKYPKKSEKEIIKLAADMTGLLIKK
jgi:hypothetical protein